MRKYFLKTKRIGFSKWSENDLPLAISLFDDERVTQFIFLNGKMSLSDIENRIKKEIENDILYGVEYWPIFNIKTEEFLGACGMRPYKAHNKSYEMGFYIKPEFWGMGFAKEAAEEVIKYAFSEIKANDLFAGHHPENKPSKNLLIKLGFEFMRYEYFKPTGLDHPLYKYKKV